MDKRKGRSTGGNAGNKSGRPSLPFALQMPGMEAMDDDVSDDDDMADEDLEAELDALMNGKETPLKAPPRQSKGGRGPAAASSSSAGRGTSQGGAPVAPPRAAAGARGKNVAPTGGGGRGQAVAASGMMDFDLSAIERMGQDDDEDDGDIDEDDPELLAELAELSPDVQEDSNPPKVTLSPPPPTTSSTSSSSAMLTLLQDRLENYEGAHQDAVYEKEAAKVRRYERTIKTIKDQIAQWKKGQPVAEDDIPPPVFIKSVLQKSLADSKPFPSQATSLTDYVAPAKEESAKTPSPAPAPPLSSPSRHSLSPSQGPGNSTPAPASGPSSPSATASSSSPTNSAGGKTSVVDALKGRRDEYRQAALQASKADDKSKAMRFMKVYKEFEIVIKAAEEGQAIDISEMPPHPEDFALFDQADSAPPHAKSPSAISSPIGKSVSATALKAPVAAPHAQTEDDQQIAEIDPSEARATFKAPDAPKTILEALQQRLDKYKSTYDEAKTAGDSSKARRMQRIVNQYKDAIKDYQAKRPVDFQELPTPPGFGPIPLAGGGRGVAGPGHSLPAGSQLAPPDSAARRTSTGSTSSSTVSSHHAPHLLPSGREGRHAQQYNFLVERQNQFKLAALKAKKEGTLETARLYLRQANGLKPMIEASANGLPVDVASVPKAPPGMGRDSDDYDVVQYEDAGAEKPAGSLKNRTESYSQLEKDLVEQVAMCLRNAQHFKKSGDIAMAEKFEKYNQQSRRDLESLRNAFKHNLPVPRFHYETRAFSVVKCCPELPEEVMELSIIRGFGYTFQGWPPSDFVTYVKWDFPFPAEDPQSGKTMAFKGTNEPEYNTTFTMKIERKSRSLARILKTKGVKCQVYIKMGLFKADRILGTANVSLETLEAKCVFHTSVDLVEGKKAVGGKLEVRVRIREPLLKQQVEELREKWLVIDQFVK